MDIVDDNSIRRSQNKCSGNQEKGCLMYIFRLKVSVGKINEGLGVKNNDKKPFHI